ncbi:unnamed protein product [Strongylus vulgaris]|uniref:Uncharacterized protein n=1 Tax=Strongylus vulgaris TaxID=40348 RepID=A0A3P7JS47_STRVU|nr:unnamed protein product [Strongylus vulgaris]
MVQIEHSELPRRHAVRVAGNKVIYLKNRTLNSQVNRIRRSPSIRKDDFTLDVRAELTALDIVDEKPILHIRNVCVSEQTFAIIIVALLLPSAILLILTIVHSCTGTEIKEPADK